jgi:hypothetical protein
MKSKLFKILGVITVVAMLVSALVAAPVFAASAVSAVTVSTTSAGGVISTTGNYSIYATLTSQLVGTTTGNITLTAGQTFIVTNTSAADQVYVSGGTGGVGSIAAVAGGTGVWTTTSATAGIVSFTGAGAGTVTFTATGSQTGTYAKTFGNATVTTGTGLVTATPAMDFITITFPSTFTVLATGAITTASLSATNGWYQPASATVPSSVASVVTGVTFASSVATNTVTATFVQGDYIGANAQILFNISGGVTNPSTAGSYTLTIQTSKDTTPVTSATFAIANPTVPVVSGVASVYNTATTPILITQSNSLNTALTAAAGVAGGATVKLTAGTYTDAAGAYAGNITLMGTDASAANVIIKGTAAWSFTGKTTVVNMVTIDASKGGLFTMASTTASGSATVSACNLKGGVLTMNDTGTGATNTCSTDSFTVLTAAVGLNPAVPTTVTGCTFTIQGTGTGISGANDVTVSGCTFTGAADASVPITTPLTGYGIGLTGGTAGSTIGTSTFTGLSNAITVATGFNVTITGNTITTCGVTATGPDAITVTSVTATYTVFILNNKITLSPEYIVYVAANDNQVVVMENQFTGNVKNAATAGNTVGTIPLNVTHNYWGGTAAAPGNPASVVAPSTKMIDYTLPLGAAPSASNSNTGSAKLDATATAGVAITASSGTTAPTILGAAALSANPVGPALPSTVTLVKYFDVFGQGATTYTGSTIDFYGPTAGSITANSAMYFYNTAYGTWQLCSAQTINAFGNYVEVTVSTTGPTAPTVAQFGGLPFALVTVPTVLGSPAPAAGVIFPLNGATGVAVSGVTFTWPIVTPPAGSTVTYQFALAQASANTSANEFAILDYSDNSITNAEPNQETLQYNTVYWWEVRAVVMSSTGAISATGPWTISMFTTGPQPTTTAVVPTTVVSSVTTVVTTNVNVTSPVTTITFTQPTSTSTPAIPAYLLWAVIAVGAILVIAVIVLIVRTRRIP